MFTAGFILFLHTSLLYWILSGTCVLFSIFLMRRGYKRGQVHPVVITEEELNAMIDERRHLIMRTAIIEQKRKETEKKEYEKRERRELKRLRQARQKKKKNEQE